MSSDRTIFGSLPILAADLFDDFGFESVLITRHRDGAIETVGTLPDGSRLGSYIPGDVKGGDYIGRNAPIPCVCNVECLIDIAGELCGFLLDLWRGVCRRFRRRFRRR